MRALAWLSLVGLALFCALRFELRTDLGDFMPAGSDERLAELARELSDSPLSRQWVLNVGAPDLDAAVDAAAQLAEKLRSHPDVAWARSGPDPDAAEQLIELYFRHRHAFLFDEPDAQAPARLSEPGLAERARELRDALSGPLAPLWKPLAPEDPLLAFPALLAGMRGGERSLGLHRGGFVTADGFAVVLAETRPPIDDVARQRALQEQLSQWLRELGPADSLVLEQSSAGRFATRIQESMQRDLLVLLTAATLGLSALFGLAFRSLRALAVALLPPALGSLGAASLGLALFGPLNGLAVGFGLTLVGVSVDYSIHLLSHRAFEPAAAEITRRLRPSLLLGALTTIASLVGLGLSGFPGFTQVGVLASAGVGLALLAALVFVPSFAPARATPTSERVAATLGRAVLALRRQRRPLAALALLLMAAGTLALPQLRWVEDLRELTVLDPAWIAEEERVRSRISQVETTRIAVVFAPDLETALARNEELARALAAQVRDGALGGFRSLRAYLRSRQLQRASERALRGDPSLPDRLDRVYQRFGFRPGGFAPFAASWEAPAPEPLELETLLDSPLAPALRPLLAELDGRPAPITLLEEIRDEAAVRRAVEAVDGALYFDQRAFVRDVYRGYRERTLWVVATGGVAVLGLLWIRYRRLRLALAAFLPSALVAFVLAALAAVSGTRIQLMHAIGIVLVLGIGVDYGIFMVDSRADARRVGITLLGLLLSCLTTLFMLGVLGLSEHPVLRALGRTTAFGVAAAFVLAPLALLVALPATRRS